MPMFLPNVLIKAHSSIHLVSHTTANEKTYCLQKMSTLYGSLPTEIQALIQQECATAAVKILQGYQVYGRTSTQSHGLHHGVSCHPKLGSSTPPQKGVRAFCCTSHLPFPSVPLATSPVLPLQDSQAKDSMRLSGSMIQFFPLL